MADETALLARLKREASIQESERLDDVEDLIPWLEEAASVHRAGSSIEDIPDSEGHLIVILACATVCIWRANKLAKEANTSGGQGYGADRNSPYEKNVRMSKELLTRYKMLVDRLGVDTTGGDIIQGRLLRRDALTDRLVPNNILPPPPRPSLKMSTGESATVGDSLIIEWTLKDYPDFKEVMLYRLVSDSSILQSWNYNSATGVPGLHDAAEFLFETSDNSVKSIKLIDVDKTVKTRYAVVNASMSGKYSISNELVIGP